MYFLKALSCTHICVNQKWLTDNGHTSGLRYWSALYWPRAKLCGYRREWFGFTFWRRAPRLHRRDCAFAGIIDLE